MAANTHVITKTLSIGICVAAISMVASPAFSKQCMHKMGYMHHPMHYNMHHGYGPKWKYGYKQGYGPMYGHGRPTSKSSNEKSYKEEQTKIDTEKLDLVDTAIAAGKFNTLVKALDAAGLRDLLKGKGPYTVFAPTDEAFAKLPEGKLDELLADKEQLVEILKYHVVPSKVNAVDILQVQELKTAGGKNIPVDSLAVAKADIETSNGTIHIVDSVLIPTM